MTEPVRKLYLARIERRYDGVRATVDVYAVDAADARRQARLSLDPGQTLIRVDRWTNPRAPRR